LPSNSDQVSFFRRVLGDLHVDVTQQLLLMLLQLERRSLGLAAKHRRGEQPAVGVLADQPGMGRLRLSDDGVVQPGAALHARQQHGALGVHDLQAGHVREGQRRIDHFARVLGRVEQQRQRALARQVVGDALALADEVVAHARIGFPRIHQGREHGQAKNGA
jgi:hypothetical protein